MFSKFLATACAALALGAVAFQSAQAADISGAGATFPAPVYAKWAETYREMSGEETATGPLLWSVTATLMTSATTIGGAATLVTSGLPLMV